MAPLVLLALLGQNSYTLSPSSAPLPVQGTAARATYTSDYVVVWVDERLDALHGRRMDGAVRTDLWWSRLGQTSSATSFARLCVVWPKGRPALATDPSTKEVHVYWLEQEGGRTDVRRAVIAPNTASCAALPAHSATRDLAELTATWSVSHALLAWNDLSRSMPQFAWFDAMGNRTQGPADVGSIASAPGSLSVSKHSGGAQLAHLDPGGYGHRYTLVDDQSATAGGIFATGLADLALDPLGDFVVVAQPGGPMTYEARYAVSTQVLLLSNPLSQAPPAVITAPARWRSALATDGVNGVAFQAFATDAGTFPLRVLPREAEPTLATNGTEALLVTSGPNRDLRVRTVALDPTGLADAGFRPVATAPPQLRRPSVAWGGDRWVIVYEEQSDAGYAGRYVTVDAGSILGVPVATPEQSPVIFRTDDGVLMLRGDLAGQTHTWGLTQGSGILSRAATPILSSEAAPAGTMSNGAVLHWTSTDLSVASPVGGSRRAFPPGRPYRSSATTQGGVWIPVASNGALKTWFLSNAELADTTVLQPLERQHASAFVQAVTPAIAAKATTQGDLLLLAWASTAQDTIEAALFTPTAPSRPVRVSGLVPPLRGLAVAPSGDGWLLAWSDGTGTAAQQLYDDGQPGARWTLSSNTVLAGEPVAAPSPGGEVAVVWPWFDEVSRSVRLKAALLPSAPARDAGVDAGTEDAGSAADAGTADAGGPVDAGVDAGPGDGGAPPDGGADPVVFDTSGCGCATTPPAAGWWLLLALALVVARRVARG